VISPGTPPSSGQPSSSSLATSMTLSVSQLPLSRRNRMMLLDRGRAHEPLRRIRIVLPADLQRDQAIVAEIDRLHLGSRLEIPEVQPAAVLAGGDIRGIEATLERFGAPHSLETSVFCRGWYQKS